MSKQLNFLSGPNEFKEDDLESSILKLNNEMLMPMKILEFKYNIKNSSGTRYQTSIIVEDCLDEKEWAKLTDVFRIGFNACLSMKKK